MRFGGDAMEKLSAVLLAAGRSSRMGREKALLAGPDGRAWWQRQREVLARAGATEIFLSARPDQLWADHASGFDAVVRDAAPGCGPLAGIVAALECAAQPHLAVLAVDLPTMESAWFDALRVKCAPGVGAVGRRGGFFEPLAAIYPREFLPLAREACGRGEFSLQRLLADATGRGLLCVREITAVESAMFENRNES